MPPQSQTAEQEPKETTVAVVSNALQQLTQGEIASQVEIAHRFPRSMELFLKRSIGMATLDEETAESCLYNRPVGKDRDGKQVYAEGLSIRCAEIVGACYGNLRVSSMTTFQDERKVTVRGMAHDLESNFASSSEVSESTVDRNNKPYSERHRLLIEKVAHAKARRDATFQVVPRALAKPVESAVRKVLAGDEKTISKRREAVEAWVKKIGIDVQRVFTVLNVKGYADLGEKELIQLTGLRTAMKDGDCTLDEAFPIRGEGKFQSKMVDPPAGTGTGADHPPGLEPTEAQQEAAAQEEQKRLAAEKVAQAEAAKSATKPAETAATTAPVQTTAPAAPVNPPPRAKVEPWNSAVHKPQLKAKLDAAKLTEAQLCGYLKESFLVEGCLTIDDVEGHAPSRLAQVLAKFETVAPKIAAMPGKSAQ